MQAQSYSRRIRSTYTSRWSSPIPEMIVCPLSSSLWTRNVGSSRENRCSAFVKLGLFRDSGTSASETTGSGTNIDVIEYETAPSVNVVPDAHSTPNIATMSPAAPSSTSCISFECMRAMRGTRTRLPSAMLTIESPRRSVPWYTRR